MSEAADLFPIDEFLNGIPAGFQAKRDAFAEKIILTGIGGNQWWLTTDDYQIAWQNLTENAKHIAALLYPDPPEEK